MGSQARGAIEDAIGKILGESNANAVGGAKDTVRDPSNK
jgi:hypothetical protein